MLVDTNTTATTTNKDGFQLTCRRIRGKADHLMAVKKAARLAPCLFSLSRSRSLFKPKQKKLVQAEERKEPELNTC